MTQSRLTSSAWAVFRTYWNCFTRQAGRRLWWAVGLLILIGLLEGTGLLMLVPLLHALGLGGQGAVGGVSGSIIALIQRSGTGGALPVALAIFVAIKTAQAALRAASGRLNLRIETDFVCFLRDRFYGAMVRANWLFLTRQRSSDLSQALLTELPLIGQATRQLLSLLSVVVVATAQVVLALGLSPAMTALALGSGLVVGLGLRRFRRRSLALGELGRGRRFEMAATVSEHLAGMKIAKSHGRETQHFAHFQGAMNEIALNLMQQHRVGTKISIWLEVGAVLALSSFVYFAVAVEGVNPTQLVVLVFVFSRLLTHSNTLQNLWQQIVQALPSFAATEHLHGRLVAAAEPAPPAEIRRLALREAMRVERACFSYDSEQPVPALRDLDLVIPARKVTALCGSSGAGKSTLADLLLSLLTPVSGRILLDGEPLAGPRLHEWRHSVGYVPQETFLFHDTIRANLLWAQPEATEDALRAALRAAAAEAFVDRLPHGLDTIVGDRGVRLSGGERQRLALARALLRRPTLLLLDEATSALDTPNERLVQDAIDRLHGELTIVLIAHRLSTVRRADQIVVLEAGRIVETGTWDELRAREGGAFQRLAAATADA